MVRKMGCLRRGAGEAWRTTRGGARHIRQMVRVGDQGFGGCSRRAGWKSVSAGFEQGGRGIRPFYAFLIQPLGEATKDPNYRHCAMPH